MRAGRPRRLAGVAGLALLAVPGFGMGVLAGVVWEDPGLVGSYLFGRTQSVPWDRQAGPEAPLPDVAAASPEAAPAEPERTAARAQPPAQAGTEEAPLGSGGRRRPAVEPDPEGTAAVQVGAFAERGAAEQLAADLRAAGYPVYLAPGEGSARWRVRVGPLRSREAAERTARQLKQNEHLPTWVLQEDR